VASLESENNSYGQYLTSKKYIFPIENGTVTDNTKRSNEAVRMPVPAIIICCRVSLPLDLFSPFVHFMAYENSTWMNSH
jgi:hypothetical protein